MKKAASDQPMPAPPAPTVQGALDDLRYEALVEAGDLLTSLAIAAREASYRGNKTLTLMHWRQIRLVTIDAICISKSIGSPADSPETATAPQGEEAA